MIKTILNYIDNSYYNNSFPKNKLECNLAFISLFNDNIKSFKEYLNNIEILIIKSNNFKTDVLNEFNNLKYLELNNCLVNNLSENLQILKIINVNCFEEMNYFETCNFKIIKSIEINYCGLTKIPNLNKFTKLENLNLSHNYIQVLENVERIDKLDLSYNKLTEIKLKQYSFSDLNISNNLLKNIDNLKLCYNLSKLNISSNRINYIDDDTFSKLYTLTNITISSYSKEAIIFDNPICKNKNYKINIVSLLPAFEFGMDIVIDNRLISEDEKSKVFTLKSNSIYLNSNSENDSSDDVYDYSLSKLD